MGLSNREVEIAIKDVNVSFVGHDSKKQVRRKRIFEGLCLSIFRYEFVCLVGRSGCGKTTLLNLIAGTAHADEGSVSVMCKSRAKGDGGRNLGYMPARDSLMPWRTARRNVELGLELQGIAKEARRARAVGMLQRLGLGEAINAYPLQLSQGMRQRVALARTWVTDPELVLMDEPFAALDAQNREQMQRELVQMWDQDRRTIVFVTHDIREAIILADRIIVVGDQSVVADMAIDLPRPRWDLVDSDSAHRALVMDLKKLLET